MNVQRQRATNLISKGKKKKKKKKNTIQESNIYARAFILKRR